MRGGPRLTPEEYAARTAEMRRLLAEGWTTEQVATHYDMTPTRVYQLVGRREYGDRCGQDIPERRSGSTAS